MTDLTTPPPMSNIDPEIMLARLKLEQQFKNWINWFYWIAGLSLVNSVLSAVGSKIVFTIGLGVTQLADAFAVIFNQRMGSNSHLFSIFSLIISLLISGLFALFGYLGNKKNKAAIIIGIILYGLDAILTIILKIYPSTIFHALALFGLIKGLSLLYKIKVPLSGKIEYSDSNPVMRDHYYDHFR